MRGCTSCLFWILGIVLLASVYFLHWEIIPMIEDNDLRIIMHLVGGFVWSLSAVIGGIASFFTGIASSVNE
jgi:hypothetical protein